MVRYFTILLLGIFFCQSPRILAQETFGIPHDRLVVEGFEISGNRITKDRIILREMSFEVGDTILKMQLISSLQNSKENLLNTSLFNFTYFDVKHLPGNRVIILVSVVERWYIWPIPIIEHAERNFSEFIQNREWDKLVYGLWLKWNNFGGRNELLTGKLRLGYINEYALSYSIPNMGKKQQHGLIMGFNISHQNEVNAATVNNQPVEIKPEDRPAQIRTNIFTKYSFRRMHYSTHHLRMDYLNYQAVDSVIAVNPDYLGEERNSLQYFNLYYEFSHDVRDSKVYPLEGFALKLRAEKLGLGIIQDFPHESMSFTGTLMFHQDLGHRLYFANATKVKYSTRKPLPHVLNKGLGYKEFMSAYEPYVMDGSDYVISKYILKLQVIRPTSRTIPFIGMEQFNKIHYALYLNLFVDAGYVNNVFPHPTSTMVNSWQYSAGVGLDLVTYYDKVFRIDYAINRYGEHGFFFHLETPIFRW